MNEPEPTAFHDLTVVTLNTLRYCQFHPTTVARYDASIPSANGQWAYLCRECFNAHGCGLGTGKGQLLRYEEVTE